MHMSMHTLICTRRAGNAPRTPLAIRRAHRSSRRTAKLPVSQQTGGMYQTFIVSKSALIGILRKIVIAVSVSGGQPPTSSSDGFVPVLRPEDLPKGVRKEIRVEGKSALIFWYRNEIYAIEARSPAEGAYSEGFIRAKFTQDGCIECPATGSLFSLADGSIVSWYPNNPVLRVLTPASTCRPMEIYPVKLTQDAICVDMSASATRGSASFTKGGSDTSLENNNVYGLEPKVYVEGTEAEAGEGMVAKVATVAVSVGATVACFAVAYACFLYLTQ